MVAGTVHTSQRGFIKIDYFSYYSLHPGSAEKGELRPGERELDPKTLPWYRRGRPEKVNLCLWGWRGEGMSIELISGGLGRRP